MTRIAETVCIRCGKMRIFLRTWKDKAEGKGTMITHVETVCPDAEVCTGTTGHAESIQIEFDPKIISFEKLLEIFFALHDPTTLNKQGNDIGTQYRSSIFYHSEDQKKVAARVKEKLDKSKKFKGEIVTEIVPFASFFEAENYHKNYFENNRMAPYCQVVIDPKIKKLLEEYSADVKKEFT